MGREAWPQYIGRSLPTIKRELKRGKVKHLDTELRKYVHTALKAIEREFGAVVLKKLCNGLTDIHAKFLLSHTGRTVRQRNSIFSINKQQKSRQMRHLVLQPTNYTFM